jgi:hypothetical protein
LKIAFTVLHLSENEENFMAKRKLKTSALKNQLVAEWFCEPEQRNAAAGSVSSRAHLPAGEWDK